jgi:DNA-directed RNA polymerase specialized sigma24 family protein
VHDKEAPVRTPVQGDGDLAVFEDQWPRLLGASRRILGSVVDADDVVQEARLRWSSINTAEVANETADALAIGRVRPAS